MADNNTADDLLMALAEDGIGLGLWMLDNTAPDKWTAQLYDLRSPLERWEGRGATPATALMAALADAGIQVTDE